MNTSRGIPTEPVPTRFSFSGMFPVVALHQRSDKFVQESSWSFHVSAAVMFAIAVAVCFLPWEDRTFLGNGPKAKYFVAGGIIWGAICGMGAGWLRNVWGQTILVDRIAGVVSIRSEDREFEIPISNVAGIQVCRNKDGYQANLVYQSSAGEFQRHCLHNNFRKQLCLRLAEQYRTGCSFQIFDHCDVHNREAN